ncbi:MAG TPA: hypothetical protein PL011_11085, partial [Kiritimatiellia bacterium]|nr:hypothetical protein [Kiritimatiellia bacterium]
MHEQTGMGMMETTGDHAEGAAGEALTPRQQALISALVAEPDVQKAAQAARVGRTTAYTWLKQPGFRDELVRRRDAVLSDAMG